MEPQTAKVDYPWQAQVGDTIAFESELGRVRVIGRTDYRGDRHSWIYLTLETKEDGITHWLSVERGHDGFTALVLWRLPGRNFTPGTPTITYDGVEYRRNDSYPVSYTIEGSALLGRGHALVTYHEYDDVPHAHMLGVIEANGLCAFAGVGVAAPSFTIQRPV